MWEANPEVLITDLGDELVLMDPQRSVMFSLNDSGRLLWQALPASKDALTVLLMQTYGLTDIQANQDVQILLIELSSRQLVQQQ